MRSVKVESASNTGKQRANLYKGDIIDGTHGQGGQSYGRKHVEFGDPADLEEALSQAKAQKQDSDEFRAFFIPA